tara:strand:+ start:1900 stop:2643 length:744 start_codon:yes stop_codon:yes gene_type:complete
MVHKRFKNGLCLVSDKYRLIYLSIPKNASTSIKIFMKKKMNAHESFIDSLNEEQEKYDIFTVLRDPEKRYYSALSEIIVRNCDNARKRLRRINHKKGIINLIKNKYDEHLIPQLDYIKDKRNNKLFNIKYYIKLDKEFEININKLLRSYGVKRKFLIHCNKKEVLGENMSKGDKLYLYFYADVRENKKWRENPYKHYELYGKSEGRFHMHDLQEISIDKINFIRELLDKEDIMKVYKKDYKFLEKLN